MNVVPPQHPTARQRLYASLLALGLGFLLFRTIVMMVGGALHYQMPWVAGLLVLEFVLDAAAVGASLRWWVTRSETHATLPLRLAAIAILLHAGRVAVYALGRIGPWPDFDVRPEQRLSHIAPSPPVVFLAAAMAALGVLGVLVIWWRRWAARTREP